MDVLAGAAAAIPSEIFARGEYHRVVHRLKGGDVCPLIYFLEKVDGGQNTEDRDDDHQFDKGKTGLCLSHLYTPNI